MNRSDVDLYEQHIPIRNSLEKVVPIIWYVVGLIGNLLAFIVWIQRKMRHSSGCYLAALALADGYFLICHMIFTLHVIWETAILNQSVVCEGFAMFYLASQYLSPILVLAFTTERYISICHPFSCHKYCTATIALRVTIGIFVFAHLLATVQLYFVTFKEDSGVCDTRDFTEFWIVWTWVTEMLVFVLLPVLTLVFNIFVIREAIKIARRNRRGSTPMHAADSSYGNKHSTTIMVLSVSFYYIFTSIPVTTVYSIYPYFPMGNTTLSDEQIDNDPIWQRHFTYFVTRTVVQQIGLSHYALNFYIYLITGRLFRKMLVHLFSKPGTHSLVETAL